MTSDFTVAPRSPLSKTNDYTSRIHAIFTQHWKTLENERQATIGKIDTWLHESKERLEKYADKQKTLINDHYNRLRSTFDEQYEENLDIANEYYDVKQVDPFNELYKECESLKFQLATFEFVKYEFEQPEVNIFREKTETKTLEEIADARRRRRMPKMNNNETENTNAASADSPSDSAVSNSKQIEDQQQLPNTKPKKKKKKKKNQAKSTPNDSNNQTTNIDASNNKCPVCFMIFPSYMSAMDRQQHANEHYIDD